MPSARVFGGASAISVRAGAKRLERRGVVVLAPAWNLRRTASAAGSVPARGAGRSIGAAPASWRAPRAPSLRRLRWRRASSSGRASSRRAQRSRRRGSSAPRSASPSTTLPSLSRVQLISSATKRTEMRDRPAVELRRGHLGLLDADEGQLRLLLALLPLGDGGDEAFIDVAAPAGSSASRGRPRRRPSRSSRRPPWRRRGSARGRSRGRPWRWRRGRHAAACRAPRSARAARGRARRRASRSGSRSRVGSATTLSLRAPAGGVFTRGSNGDGLVAGAPAEHTAEPHEDDDGNDQEDDRIDVEKPAHPGNWLAAARHAGGPRAVSSRNVSTLSG